MTAIWRMIKLEDIALKTELFGKTADNQKVELITLENTDVKLAVSTLGAALVSLEVLDNKGNFTDVAAGFDSVKAYETQKKYIGAVIGRYANRIAGGCFSLGGKQYTLEKNEPPNHLHGGTVGFHNKVWQAIEISDGVCFSLQSHHLEGGYPGNLNVKVSYILSGNTMTIKYVAESDQDSICNLTSHAYFNLNGHAGEDVTNHILKLYSAAFTPVINSECIPSGEIIPVKNTPMDFKDFTKVGSRINDKYEQLVFGNGYDHNWVVDGEIGTMRPAADIYSPSTGIRMKTATTMPGIQFYSGNRLGGAPAGKNNTVYRNRSAFCLESQYYPNSPNTSEFPQASIKKNEEWSHTTSFEFSIKSK